MKQNMGNGEALLRTWAGLFIFGLGIIRDSRTMMLIGSGKAATGITKYCPCKDVMHVVAMHHKCFYEQDGYHENNCCPEQGTTEEQTTES